MFGFKGLNKSLISNGLVLYIDAANRQSFEPGTTNAYDLIKIARRSDNQNIFNAILYNGVGWSSDYGGIFTFDGIDDFMQINSISNDTILSLKKQTASVWVRQRGGTTSFITIGSTGGDNNRNCYLYGNNTTFLRYLIGNGSTNRLCTINSGMPGLNTWFNIVGTYDLQTMRLYINGSEVQTTSTTIIPLQSTSLYSRLGESTKNSSVKFEGDMASWAVYDRALTANEVQQNFEALRDRFGI
jgi:hypothetical protein